MKEGKVLAELPFVSSVRAVVTARLVVDRIDLVGVEADIVDSLEAAPRVFRTRTTGCSDGADDLGAVRVGVDYEPAGEEGLDRLAVVRGVDAFLLHVGALDVCRALRVQHGLELVAHCQLVVEGDAAAAR